MTPKSKSSQYGFSMVTVIFLLVVLAGAAVYIIEITQMQIASAGLRVMESRAYLAAVSAAERFKYRAYYDSAFAYCSTSEERQERFDFDDADDMTLKNLYAQVNYACTQSQNGIITWNIRVYGKAFTPSNPLYVSRGIKVQFTRDRSVIQ